VKGDIYSLLSIMREETEISLPEIESQVSDILGQMGTEEAGEALSDVMKDDPDLVSTIIDNNPESIENYLQQSPESTDKISGALEDPNVMSTLSTNPDTIDAMSSHYSENPEDIPDALVRQITKAVEDEKATAKGDIQEYYEKMLSKQHIDGTPWSGTLQDLASVQGKSFGGGDLVDPKGYDNYVKTAIKFTAGKAKSPLRMTERHLREVIRNALREGYRR